MSKNSKCAIFEMDWDAIFARLFFYEGNLNTHLIIAQ